MSFRNVDILGISVSEYTLPMCLCLCLYFTIFFPNFCEASITKTYCSDELLLRQCVFSLLDRLKLFQYVSVTVFGRAFDTCVSNAVISSMYILQLNF